jgi:hypothetical protein
MATGLPKWMTTPTWKEDVPKPPRMPNPIGDVQGPWATANQTAGNLAAQDQRLNNNLALQQQKQAGAFAPQPLAPENGLTLINSLRNALGTGTTGATGIAASPTKQTSSAGLPYGKTADTEPVPPKQEGYNGRWQYDPIAGKWLRLPPDDTPGWSYNEAAGIWENGTPGKAPPGEKDGPVGPIEKGTEPTTGTATTYPAPNTYTGSTGNTWADWSSFIGWFNGGSWPTDFTTDEQNRFIAYVRAYAPNATVGRLMNSYSVWYNNQDEADATNLDAMFQVIQNAYDYAAGMTNPTLPGTGGGGGGDGQAAAKLEQQLNSLLSRWQTSVGGGQIRGGAANTSMYY